MFFFFFKNRLVVWFQVYITDTRPTTNRNWSLSSKGATAMCWICHFLAQNGPFVLNKIFLVQIIIITFIYLLPLFNVQNLKKSYSRSRVMRMCHFWAQNGPLAPNNFFFLKFNIIFIYLLAPFITQNFKKFFQWIQSYEDM